MNVANKKPVLFLVCRKMLRKDPFFNVSLNQGLNVEQSFLSRVEKYPVRPGYFLNFMTWHFWTGLNFLR
jgi:hypothetical protein